VLQTLTISHTYTLSTPRKLMRTDKRATSHEFFNTLAKSSLENYLSQTACGRFLQNALQIIFFYFCKLLVDL